MPRKAPGGPRERPEAAPGGLQGGGEKKKRLKLAPNVDPGSPFKIIFVNTTSPGSPGAASGLSRGLPGGFPGPLGHPGGVRGGRVAP